MKLITAVTVKIEVVRLFQEPKYLKNMRNFLGVYNHYTRFKRNDIEKIKLSQSLCGKYHDKQACARTFFRTMKNALTLTNILVYPNFRK